MSIDLKNCFACLPKTERGRPVVLGGHPNGKTFLYCHGNNIIIRDVENPSIVDIYSEHAKETTVAKYSPSGFYIASADITGKVRIWDTVNETHILKSEFQPLGGKIKDLDWSPDNQKIALVGAGRGSYGACITYDSGNTVGSVTGHSKEANSCAYRPIRPFRLVTSAEDYAVCFLKGPPFKLESTFLGHSNFVNSVRYSPDGKVFLSGGADGKAFIFDGTSGEKIGELGEKAHNGGIYGLSFRADSRQVLTVSGDKTAKIWDMTTQQVVTEFKMGTELFDMQVGCLWLGPHILTVSLSGYINYLDADNPSTPIRIIKGHNKPITTMAVSRDRSKIYSGTVEGNISYWDADSGVCEEVKGKGHSNQVQDAVMDEDDTLVTVSFDDTLRETLTSENQFGSSATKLDSQPKALSRVRGLTVVASFNHIIVLEGSRKLSAIEVQYEPRCITLHPGRTQVVVGGSNVWVIYELSNGALSEVRRIELFNCEVSDVMYSPDGMKLAVVGSDKQLRCYAVADDYKELFNTTGHNARVNGVAWSPDSNHIACCSIDGSIAVYIPEKSLKNKIGAVKDAHKKSWANKIEWIDNNTLVTVGQDSNVKEWTVKY